MSFVPTSVGLPAPPSSPATILLIANPPAPTSATTAIRPPTIFPVLRLPVEPVGTTVAVGSPSAPEKGGGPAGHGENGDARGGCTGGGGGCTAGGGGGGDPAPGLGGSKEMPSSLVSTDCLSPRLPVRI